MPSNTVEEDEVKGAVQKFSERFGSEAIVEPLSVRGRVLEAKFTGNMCYTCGVRDYFDDFALVLEEVSGVPYAVWYYSEVPGLEPSFIVTLVRLDFLDEITRSIVEVGDLVEKRMKEFEEIGRHEEELFKELCFCILTANFTADGGMKIQEDVGDGFLILAANELAERLRELGHRYPDARAGYIGDARRFFGRLSETLQNFRSSHEAREWLVRNVKGLGYKEASHFLRNVGFRDVAILDRHILRFLFQKNLVAEVPKTLSRGVYLRLERLLEVIAQRMNLTLGELDLYLWYRMTGRVLK